jgi:hypothetical protein
MSLSLTAASFADTVLPVVVVYGHNFLHVPLVHSLISIAVHQNKKIDLVVFDNSPPAQSSSLSHAYLNLNYVANPSNPGLGPCYNQAAEIARQSGKTWLLLFDQDAVLPTTLFERYEEAIRVHPGYGLYAPVLESADGRVLSPFRWVFNRPSMFRHVSSGVHNARRRGICNNGMLVSVDAFRAVGGYHNRIRLDFADVWFFRRFAATHSAFVVTDCVLRHDLSSITESDPGRALRRFVTFCHDARVYATDYSFAGEVAFFTFARAVKQACVWREPRFVTTFFRAYRTRKWDML